MGVEGGYEIGFLNDMFKGNKYDVVEVSSLVDFLWVEVETEVVPCDRMSNGRDFGELDGLG